MKMVSRRVTVSWKRTAVGTRLTASQVSMFINILKIDLMTTPRIMAQVYKSSADSRIPTREPTPEQRLGSNRY